MYKVKCKINIEINVYGIKQAVNFFMSNNIFLLNLYIFTTWESKYRLLTTWVNKEKNKTKEEHVEFTSRGI
jgi:hypothetical protein